MQEIEKAITECRAIETALQKLGRLVEAVENDGTVSVNTKKKVLRKHIDYCNRKFGGFGFYFDEAIRVSNKKTRTYDHCDELYKTLGECFDPAGTKEFLDSIKIR